MPHYSGRVASLVTACELPTELYARLVIRQDEGKEWFFCILPCNLDER